MLSAFDVLLAATLVQCYHDSGRKGCSSADVSRTSGDLGKGASWNAQGRLPFLRGAGASMGLEVGGAHLPLILRHVTAPLALTDDASLPDQESALRVQGSPAP